MVKRREKIPGKTTIVKGLVKIAPRPENSILLKLMRTVPNN
jgi:hypothetical protein